MFYTWWRPYWFETCSGSLLFFNCDFIVVVSVDGNKILLDIRFCSLGPHPAVFISVLGLSMYCRTLYSVEYFNTLWTASYGWRKIWKTVGNWRSSSRPPTVTLSPLCCRCYRHKYEHSVPEVTSCRAATPPTHHSDTPFKCTHWALAFRVTAVSWWRLPFVRQSYRSICRIQNTSKGYWRWCITFLYLVYLDIIHRPSF
jgi:hypothetical protein